MMLGGNISKRTNTLCLLLSLFAAVIFLAAELLIRRSPRL